ncbi:MAG: Gfo/Idh/MocA family oxidoreductase [Armatimonadetes bacterium]|nr:Gfo/Idh/MocA family oxidoreductase [Armatimonadota bacterium]
MAVRIGFVGCGGIARHHMRTLAKIEDAQMVAFYDVDAERARSAAGEFGGTAYENLDIMLDDAGCQACFICVPPFAHGDLEMAVIERGIALFIEKPVAIDMAVARQIEKAIAERGLVNSVGYHWRYMAATEKAQELLAGKTVASVLGYWMGGLPGVWWWRKMETSGGQLVEQTTHIVDLARLFAGEVKSVAAAYALRCLHDVEELNVPDVGTVTVNFETGAVGQITNCCHLNFGFRVGIDVIACDIAVRIDPGSLRVQTAEGTQDIEASNDPTLAEDTAFLRAVETGDMSGIRSPYSDAVKTLAVTLAANLSAREGRVVEVAEVG